MNAAPSSSRKVRMRDAPGTTSTVGRFSLQLKLPPALGLVALSLGLSATGMQASTRACIAPSDAAKHVNKNVCIAAHVYDVVQLTDGTRFLDVCSPETSDEKCRFTIVSLNDDRVQVGDLERYRQQEIEVRGILRPVSDRTEMVLSREQQFHGGAEKFRPNPVLLKGFSAEGHATAFSDPALRSSHHRGALTRQRTH